MFLKTHKLLHYLLIILMMFMPLRGVLAVTSAPCEMAHMSSSLNHQKMAASHEMSTMASSKAMHHQHNPSMPDQTVSLKTHQCCCCDDSNGSCAGNCDMGMTVSLLLQTSSCAPVIINVTESSILSTEVLLRELTPPSRPPANFS